MRAWYDSTIHDEDGLKRGTGVVTMLGMYKVAGNRKCGEGGGDSLVIDRIDR